MPLAVTLLGAVAIASVIGTILQQNQPYQDYIIKFGPFWHELYRSMGLYDIYSSAWFLILLAFLVASTSICLIQNGPSFIRSARDFRERMGSGVLKHMPEHQHWRSEHSRADLIPACERVLTDAGYRLRRETENDRVLIAAKRGSVNRLGYLFTHFAVVIICVGGLLDGNVPMKWRSVTGNLAIETRDLPASQIPAESRLPAGNTAFRANINIPEGAAANFAFINLGPGYVLQELPFNLRLQEFRIEHYSTGQPKSFESDLVLHDPATGETIEQTISVNHPLRYGNFSIYQASFQDGGSQLQLRLHPLNDPDQDSLALEARVEDKLSVNTPLGELQLELDDFRAHNIIPAGPGADRRFQDNGPSFVYRVRQRDGTAREYQNYMFPIEVDERRYFLSGVRSAQAEEFRYLYIPVDDEDSPSRFMRLLAVLHDEDRLRELLAQYGQVQPVTMEPAGVDESREQISRAALEILRLFRDGGFQAIAERIETDVPEEHRELASQAYIKLMYDGLQLVLQTVLEEEGSWSAGEDLTKAQTTFLDDAVQALAGLPAYGAPFFLELVEFEQRQASGLMITRSPGKPLVYVGFVLLLAGVFLLFYVAQRRVWVELREQDGGTEVQLAGESNRLQNEFKTEFERIATTLQPPQHNPTDTR